MGDDFIAPSSAPVAQDQVAIISAHSVANASLCVCNAPSCSTGDCQLQFRDFDIALQAHEHLTPPGLHRLLPSHRQLPKLCLAQLFHLHGHAFLSSSHERFPRPRHSCRRRRNPLLTFFPSFFI
jgi:hypothetical protein